MKQGDQVTPTKGASTRRVALAGAGGIALALAVTSVAWACTAVMGPIKICSAANGTCTNTSTGTVGRAPELTKVKVWASGLKVKPAKYELVQGDCHNSTTIMKTPTGEALSAMTTNNNGKLDRTLSTTAIEPYKARLPEMGSIPGEYSLAICARETYPLYNDTASDHARFTVVVT